MACSSLELREFLAGYYGEEIGVLRPLQGGEWSTAYAFRRADFDCVVRLGEHVEDFLKDRLAAAHASPPLPVPKVIDVGEALGGYFAVSERAYGEVLEELAPAKMRAVVPAVLRMLDAAREVDLSRTRGYGGWGGEGSAPYGSWAGYLLAIEEDRDRLRDWRARMVGSGTGIGPFEEAYGRLRDLAGSRRVDRHLIHGDLLHGNVLIAGDRITAVLDWGCSAYGDFLYDLAWLSFWAPWHSGMAGIDWEAEALAHYRALGLDVPDYEERMLCCKLHIGLDAQAYCAFTRRWDELDAVAHHTLRLARS